ncbi:MAG: hypothetical protein SWC96_14915 [Thermodesulfobacteriota bacterium]|nr:hypothetical protein [Thermodesulfobacteriota bacterium]
MGENKFYVAIPSNSGSLPSAAFLSAIKTTGSSGFSADRCRFPFLSSFYASFLWGCDVVTLQNRLLFLLSADLPAGIFRFQNKFS